MISIIISVLVYLPSLTVFFSGDDWAHMRVSQILNFQEFLNFFSFTRTDQSLAFYRPLPQQVFFNIFGWLFKFNSLPYHIFVLVCFASSLYLLFKLAKKLNFSDRQANLSVLIYGIAVANFPRIYFLSAFQDVLLPLFVSASLIYFLDKKYLWSLVFFIFSLLSKETAVVTPILLVGLLIYVRKISWKPLIPFVIVTFIYLYFRFKYFGSAVGDSYVYDFSIKKTLNTLLWYIFWTFGAPETLVDYVSSGLKIVPKFFTDFPVWSKIILYELGSLFAFFALSIFYIRKEIVKKYRLIVFCLYIFLISLGPVIFMPWHKFTHALSLPMIGSSLLLGYFFSNRKLLTSLFVAVFIVTNLSMNIFLFNRHYSVNRSRISEKVYQLFINKYPKQPANSYFVFMNDPNSPNQGNNQSKELSLALSQSDFFKAFYQDRSIKVFYQDLGITATPSGNPIYIDSNQFLLR